MSSSFSAVIINIIILISYFHYLEDFRGDVDN